MYKAPPIRQLTLDDLWLMRIAIEKSKSAFYLLASDGSILYVNAYTCQSVGYGYEELVGKHVWDFDPDFSLPDWGAMWEGLRQNGIVQIETRHRRKDGTTFPVSLTGNYIAQHGQEYCFTFAQDITERRQAEAALKEQKDFFRLIAENIDDFIAVVDLDGRRLYNSPSYQRLFDGKKDLVGTDAFAEIHPDDRERVKQIFQDTVKTGIGHPTEFRFVLADGSIRHMESRGGVMLDANGRVARVVVVSRDITDRKAAEQRVQYLAHHDALTDLPNRNLMSDRLSQALAYSRRDNAMLAVMFVDLDKFKPVNDAMGHDIGDQLLKEVAVRLQACVPRESDSVSRIGGDEFLILLARIRSRRDASSVAEKLLHAMSQPFHLGPHTVSITASIGVAIFPFHGQEEKELIKNADRAMYRAKESGQNCYRFFSEESAGTSRLKQMKDGAAHEL
jgi:diguanylate cyclase (GGDEF)-like protein/PAS domain S-box-containing protein